MEREQAERVRQERVDKVNAMRTYLDSKCKLVRERLQSVTNELQTVKDDAVKLENEVLQIVSSPGKNGQELSYEVRLLRILRNKAVNELAVKYLAEGFSLQAEEFIEKVRKARSEEKIYKDALRKSEEQLDAAFEESKNWARASRAQRDAEIRRLEREIDELEKKRQSTRRTMMGAESVRREWKDKMWDYRAEIDKKRAQIDYLRNPDANRAIETRAVSRAQDVQRTAINLKEERDYNIHRRMKPQTSVMAIADEMGRNTIDKLRAAIKKKLDGKEGEMKLLLRKMEIAQEIVISIPVSEMGELNRLKARADREL
jgi:chromosome segregation ATPase